MGHCRGVRASQRRHRFEGTPSCFRTPTLGSVSAPPQARILIRATSRNKVCVSSPITDYACERQRLRRLPPVGAPSRRTRPASTPPRLRRLRSPQQVQAQIESIASICNHHLDLGSDGRRRVWRGMVHHRQGGWLHCPAAAFRDRRPCIASPHHVEIHSLRSNTLRLGS